MIISNDIKYIGVNDYKTDLFEGQYKVLDGISYNSYVILDEKIAVMDTVDQNFAQEWLENMEIVLKGRKPDYLIVQHMEPDHSANIAEFLKKYPETMVVSSAPAFTMMRNLFGEDYRKCGLVIKEGDKLSLGKHMLHFIAAPMVHWPEVMVTYDAWDKVLFSADGFGKFGAPKKVCMETDIMDSAEYVSGDCTAEGNAAGGKSVSGNCAAYTDWANEARRYYIGICGRFGMQVQALLKKAAGLDIQKICPLHGPVLTENLGYYLNLYDIWSSYGVENEGVMIAYTSVYGNTKAAVGLLAEKLREKGCPEVVVYDLARCDMSEALSDAFRYGKLVLATTTYNADIFPFMKTFIHELKDHNYQNRTVGLMENGMWAPAAARVMRGMLEECRDLRFAENAVKITAVLNDAGRSQIELLAEELCKA